MSLGSLHLRQLGRPYRRREVAAADTHSGMSGDWRNITKDRWTFDSRQRALNQLVINFEPDYLTRAGIRFFRGYYRHYPSISTEAPRDRLRQAFPEFDPHSSGPASPNACLLVGASASNTGFSARLVTLVPCLGSSPW